MIEQSKGKARFNPEEFLDGPHVAKHVAHFEKAQTIYAQGECCSSVLYIKSGTVKLSATDKDGREGVIAILKAGNLLGEACLSDAFSERVARAMAMEPTIVFVIQRKEMLRVLREEQDFRTYFISYLLRRNARTEADLIDQLRNSSEKRLARVLYLLARPDKEGSAETNAPIIPQETLAELIGTTRSRVNLFMNKFRRLGFIDYSKGRLRVHNSIVEGVLHN
jgi:CRP/FNR family transcriptional regulator, cyclic AMP receptor protein